MESTTKTNGYKTNNQCFKNYINMKNFILLILLSVSLTAQTQTVIRFDYMETWNWAGVWWSTGGNPAIALTPNGGASTWATNASVTPSESAVLYGAGNGSSFIEQDWYVLPNITGLDANKQYQLRFRLASYTFTAPAAATRGVDVGDFVDVQVSTNGGVSYVSELRITGNNNSQFPYTSTGIISHVANGSFTNSAAPAGDVYQSPAGVNTTGPSTVHLDLPIGITQVAVDILCRVNSAGEEWWLDNIELVEIDPLPIELLSFSATIGNIIYWETSAERDNDYFLLEYSTTGEFNENSVITKIPGAGTTNLHTQYSFNHADFENSIGYYKLTQVDFDGNFKEYGPISIDNRKNKTVVKYYNIMGQEVKENTNGIVFELYDDGTTKKIYK